MTPDAHITPNAELHQGDALLLLPSMPTASCDALITDPPYCSGGTTAADRTGRSARAKYVSSDAGHDLPDFPGDERDQRSFTAWCALWLAEARRIVRPGGLAVVFIDWRQLPAMSDAIQAAGWRWRGVGVWHKPAARPQPGIANGCEYLLWASSAPHRVPEAPLPYLPGMRSHSTPRGANRLHITAKPLELMRELVTLAPPGGRILDPFTGSGTTGVAALREGRRFVGVEITATYAAVAAERLRSADDGAS